MLGSPLISTKCKKSTSAKAEADLKDGGQSLEPSQVTYFGRVGQQINPANKSKTYDVKIRVLEVWLIPLYRLQ